MVDIKSNILNCVTWLDTFTPLLKSSSVIHGPSRKSRSNIQFMDMETTWIRYCTAGTDGPTIILNADPPLTIESYDKTIQELSCYFRVIVFEIPGFGFSFPKQLNFKYDFDGITKVLVQFLKNLDLGPYILSLPCLLGFCGIRIANLFPELVSHVVLNQVPTWQGALKWKQGRSSHGILEIPILGQLTLNLLKRQRCSNWFNLVFAEPNIANNMTEIALWSYQLGACFPLASCFQFYLTDQQPDLEPIKQPSLIVWGECDGSHQQTNKELTRLLALDFEEVYIPNAGHSPEVETPQIFTELVRDLVS